MRKIDSKAIFVQRMNQLADEIGEGKPTRLAAELRLPERNIIRYCSGESQPWLAEAAVLAKRAGVSLDWLTGLSDERVVQGGPVPLEDAPPDTPPIPPRRRGRRRSEER